MESKDFKKATNLELRTILFDDPMATKWDKAFARTEYERRKTKRMSSRLDKRAGTRR